MSELLSTITSPADLKKLTPEQLQQLAQEMRDELVRVGTDAMLDVLERWPVAGTPQQGEPTYARKLTRDDLRIAWSRDAIDIHRLVRVGGAWTTHNGVDLKVWRTSLSLEGDGIDVHAGDGPIEILEVQPAGKPRMPASAWAHGVRWQPGDRLGT